MRKIIVGARISMDGVTQAPSGPAEDAGKGFKFGGWRDVEIKIGDTALNSPSKAEAGRQERSEDD